VFQWAQLKIVKSGKKKKIHAFVLF
jgi:hypothetical protein